MNAKLSAGQKFSFGRFECVVSCVDKFGPEPHYGFMWHGDDGTLHAGWAPCWVVENFTGYYQPSPYAGPGLPIPAENRNTAFPRDLI